jgi:hypothetical protein
MHPFSGRLRLAGRRDGAADSSQVDGQFDQRLLGGVIDEYHRAA